METVAGETPLSSATSRRVTAARLTFRRVKNNSVASNDCAANGPNIFITGGARRLAVRARRRGVPFCGYAVFSDHGVKAQPAEILEASRKLGSLGTFGLHARQMPAYQAYPASGSAEPRPLPNFFRSSVTVMCVTNFTLLWPIWRGRRRR